MHVYIDTVSRNISVHSRSSPYAFCIDYRVIPKRATALQFTSDDKYILVADKAGDLHRYPLSDSAHSGDHLLGHFSMLLDMVCGCGFLVIMITFLCARSCLLATVM